METYFDLLPEDMLILVMRCLKQDSYILCNLSEYINKIQCKYINDIMNGCYQEDDIFTETKFENYDKYIIENILDTCSPDFCEVKYSDSFNKAFSNILGDDFKTVYYITLANTTQKLARVMYRLKDGSSVSFMILELNNKIYAYLYAFWSNYNPIDNPIQNYCHLYLYKDYKDLMLNIPKEVKLYLLDSNRYKGDIIKSEEILPYAVTIYTSDDVPMHILFEY